MIEIVPNWHPVFVHFTVGLVVTSPFLFLLAKLVKSDRIKTDLRAAGRWTLWTGALAAAVTVAAGFIAFGSVAHDDAAHAAMIEHRNWALPTAVLIIGLAGWSFRLWRDGKDFPNAFYALLVAAMVLIGITGLEGGELVYEHGLGVESLPEVEAGAESGGHSHSHDQAGEADHDHDQAGEAEHDHDESEGEPHSHDTTGPDTATPEGTLAAFQAALRAGEASQVSQYMAEDVLIYESGGAEKSLADYASHHMGADMAFLASMENEPIEQRVFRLGDHAVVVTESRTYGTYEGRDMDIRGTETALLELTGGGWLIRHIHWSSRRAN